MIEHILINMKFTDKSHDTLESVTVNLKDYFAEYGYIPRTEAIPIEWIENYTRKNFPLEHGEVVLGFIADMLEDWRKENDD